MFPDKIKFIATDMDGTLLDEYGQLDASFFDIYQQLKDKNILFAAASGRQYYSLIDTFTPIKDEILFIAENGTLVMHKGEELYSCTIDAPSIEQIITQARQIPVLLLCCVARLVRILKLRIHKRWRSLPSIIIAVSTLMTCSRLMTNLSRSPFVISTVPNSLFIRQLISILVTAIKWWSVAKSGLM